MPISHIFCDKPGCNTMKIWADLIDQSCGDSGEIIYYTTYRNMVWCWRLIIELQKSD
jgi:hypothetical protein